MSSWITFNDDLTIVEKHFGMPCHAYMQNDPQGSSTLITACPKKDELSIEFIKFLARGPYRALQDKISLETDPKGHYYIRCSDLDKWPSNILYNFCIATRIPIEHVNIMNNWKDMVDSGVDENVAWALASYYYKGVESTVAVSPRHLINHYATDPSSSLQNLMMGTFNWDNVSPKSFAEAPEGCRPTNCIWGLSSAEERAMIRGKTPLEICDVFGLTKPKVQEPDKHAEYDLKAALEAVKMPQLVWKPALQEAVDHNVNAAIDWVAAVQAVQPPVINFNFDDDDDDEIEDPNGWDDDDKEDELDDDF